MRPRYAATALLVGAFCAGATVACGGDDDSPIVPVETQTAPSDQLSQDEFIDEADAICEEANVAIASLADSAADPSTQISEEREIVEGVLDQIDSLGAPRDDEAALDDFIDGFEGLADNLDKQELAAERDDTTALADAQTEEASIQTELATAGEEYGFRECGQEGEATSTDTGTDATGGDTGVAPAAPEPVAPAPVAPEPAAPAPATPAPTPPSGGTGDDTGGTAPGDSGGVSP